MVNARDVDDLDTFATKLIYDLWRSIRIKRKIPNIPGFDVATLYHFGISEATGKISAYKYRAEKDFVSERLTYGPAVKPECVVPDKFNFPNDIKKMMREQRSIQSEKSPEERVYIGGEIIIHHLTADGVFIPLTALKITKPMRKKSLSSFIILILPRIIYNKK